MNASIFKQVQNSGRYENTFPIVKSMGWLPFLTFRKLGDKYRGVADLTVGRASVLLQNLSFHLWCSESLQGGKSGPHHWAWLWTQPKQIAALVPGGECHFIHIRGLWLKPGSRTAGKSVLPKAACGSGRALGSGCGRVLRWDSRRLTMPSFKPQIPWLSHFRRL